MCLYELNHTIKLYIKIIKTLNLQTKNFKGESKMFIEIILELDFPFSELYEI